ncbi:hypothetical protein PHLCEN_2v8059 [Hermanssonia centrifuga]|uniref:Uncharacterized protein n=1 Tax=Hermanssonia centrifuga TaxID=98765 RepID=A0A2R6NUX8_9APHY|nr:hypothetical protein PHLCEN_2v8059 [Hermanssonia centrifuga]
MSYELQNCGRLLNITNFYVDGSSAPNATYDPLENPVDIENGVASIVYLQAINEFQTTHLLEVSAWHGLDQQYAYPFDTYFLDTSIVALDSDAQKSFHIISLKPVDSTNNFFPYVVTDGPAWLRDSSGAEQFEGRYLRMTFRRTILTQFFIVALFSVNWGLTLVVVLITIWANDGNEVNDSILVLPLSVILTIPALRALWVGAPGFDSCGIFLQMIIVAICSIFLVMRVGLSSKKERELRRRRRKKYHRDVEEEDIPISDIEWMETHGLKRASAMPSTPQENSA